MILADPAVPLAPNWRGWPLDVRAYVDAEAEILEAEGWDQPEAQARAARAFRDAWNERAATLRAG